MKRLLLIIISFTLPFSGYSQTWKLKRYEVWGGVSVFNYFGDIGGSASENTLLGLKDISFRSIRPGINIGMSYRVNERIYVHGTNSLGLLASSDKNSRNSGRNYAFSSIANELSVQGVFYFIKENQNYYYSIMKMRGGLRGVNKPISAYVFAGFGGVFYKPFPKKNLIGSPQFNDDQFVAMVFPVGLGAKLAFSPRVSYGLEIGVRYVFSDRLDGINPSPSKHNDLYYLLNFKVVYRLTKGKGLKQIFKQ